MKQYWMQVPFEFILFYIQFGIDKIDFNIQSIIDLIKYDNG